MEQPLKFTDRIDRIISWLLETKNALLQAEELHMKLTAALTELVSLNDPKIDAILMKFGIAIQKDGNQIFPRPVRYPEVIPFNKKN